MSNSRSWFCFIKTLFSQGTQPQHHLKRNRRRWLFATRKKTLKALSFPETEALQHEPVANEARELIIDIEAYEANILPINDLFESDVEYQAALKIQTSFRGLLARKALRALKGFVILQGIIRGQTVRRQAATTLRCLQSIVRIQSEICARRRDISQEMVRKSDYLSLELVTEMPKMQLSTERRSSDCRFSIKDDQINTIPTRKDAIPRRQRIKTYSFNPRITTDSEDDDAISKGKYFLSSFTEDGLGPSSSGNLPTYMAATKSAKAKTRTLGSPRLKPIHFDSYSDGDSPYKYTFSQMSSINSDVSHVTSSKLSKVSDRPYYSSSQQNSPSLKGVSGPVRSNRIQDERRVSRLDLC